MNARRLLFLVPVLILACIAPPWVAPVSETPTVAVSPTATSTPTKIVPVSKVWTATVSQVLVYVRDAPGGDVQDALKSGDKVTVLICDDRWCNIRYISPETKKQTTGYIFKGCLDVKSNLGCESKP